jgi:hypothetical protein
LLATATALGAGCRDTEFEEGIAENAGLIEENSKGLSRETSGRSEVDEELQADLIQDMSRIDALESALALVKGDLNAHLSAFIGLESDVAANSSAIADALASVASLDADLATLDARSAGNQTDIAANVSHLNAVDASIVAHDQKLNAVRSRLALVQEDWWAFNSDDGLLGKVVDVGMGSFVYDDIFDTIRLIEQHSFDSGAVHYDSATYYLTDNCTGTDYIANTNGAWNAMGVIQQSTGRKLFPVDDFNTVTVTLRGRLPLNEGGTCETIAPTVFDALELEELGTPEPLGRVSASSVLWSPLFP